LSNRATGIEKSGKCEARIGPDDVGIADKVIGFSGGADSQFGQRSTRNAAKRLTSFQVCVMYPIGSKLDFLHAHSH
jgi:hypothetical protein